MLTRFGMQDCNPLNTPMCANEKLSQGDPEESIDVPYQNLIGSPYFQHFCIIVTYYYFKCHNYVLRGKMFFFIFQTSLKASFSERIRFHSNCSRRHHTCLHF